MWSSRILGRRLEIGKLAKMLPVNERLNPPLNVHDFGREANGSQNICEKL